MLAPHDEVVVRRCLQYLARHLRGPRSEHFSETDETFYLMALRGCTLAALKATFRAGIARWRYMPKPADILDVYQEVAARPSLSEPAATLGPGCPECDGTGWRTVSERAVTPCSCARGQARRRRT